MSQRYLFLAFRDANIIKIERQEVFQSKVEGLPWFCYGQMGMTLFDFRPTAVPPSEDADFVGAEYVGADFLGIDDLLSRSGDDLGLDVDASGHLVLVEGRDFD